MMHVRLRIFANPTHLNRRIAVRVEGGSQTAIEHVHDEHQTVSELRIVGEGKGEHGMFTGRPSAGNAYNVVRRGQA